jgi:PQQ-dependent dehydrogenase (methanol/ethanol family)
MKLHFPLALLAAACLSGPAHTATAPTAATAATVAATTDFPKVSGNLGNQNYSALSAIHKNNVRQLGAAWMNSLEGGAKSGNAQSTAVAVDGVLYIETAQGRVHAVDGKTGAVKWSYNPGRGGQTRRGVAVGGGKVYTLTTGNYVIALDQQTGQVVWERQHNGYGNIAKVAVVYHDGLIYVGTNDGSRGAGLALNASNGDLVWHFFGAAAPGTIGGDTWEGDTYLTGGATPWIHPAVDPELNLVYWTFGNARAGSSQNGSTRGGQNLFANSIVAMDAKTGEYRWHFQSVHHDIWDMDNVMAPVLADISVKGVPRKAVVYGSKTGMYFILDRRDGSPIIDIEERPVPVDARQKSWPTQPYSRGGPFIPNCPTTEGPARAVPNFKTGCLFVAHWDEPILSFPGQGGGPDWNHQSFSHKTQWMYTGVGYVGSAHSLTEASNGLRPLGTPMSGGIVAVNPATNQVVWKKDLPWSVAHGNGILSTASNLLFMGQPDGNLLAMDALNGKELWRFQTGASINASPIAYQIDGEQYIAVFAGGSGLPFADAPRGDYLWAFKVGGQVPPLPAPVPPATRRQITAAAVEGSVVNNTVILNRSYSNGVVGTVELDTVNAMAPQHLRVPVGTTVTFKNPADNSKVHCATQFFEGLFNAGPLAPGEVFAYTFNQRGEYFYNDCTSPRATGKVVVY